MWPAIAGAAVVLTLGVVIYLKVRADANQSLDFATEQAKQSDAALDATRAANAAKNEQARKDLDEQIKEALATGGAERDAMLRVLNGMRGVN